MSIEGNGNQNLLRVILDLIKATGIYKRSSEPNIFSINALRKAALRARFPRIPYRLQTTATLLVLREKILNA